MISTLILLTADLSFFENTVDADQLASHEATRLVTTLFSRCLKVHAYNLKGEC